MKKLKPERILRQQKKGWKSVTKKNCIEREKRGERPKIFALTSGGDLLNKLSPTRYWRFRIISNCSAFKTLKLLVLLLNCTWFFPLLITFKDGDEWDNGNELLLLDCNKCGTCGFLPPPPPSSLLSWLEELWWRDEEEEWWLCDCWPIWRLDRCLLLITCWFLITVDVSRWIDLGSLLWLLSTSGDETSIDTLDEFEDEFDVRDEFEWLQFLQFEFWIIWELNQEKARGKNKMKERERMGKWKRRWEKIEEMGTKLLFHF